ncbi:MAG: hypothetical protein IKW00_07840 [Clostridia bacterium]|nr:hypothetical protein [Clostridia bacterium]
MAIGSILKHTCSKNMPTISLMDEFEMTTNGQYCYDTLKLERAFTLMVENYILKVALYIKRRPVGTKVIRDGLTFTKFKNKIVGKDFGRASASMYAVTKTVYDGALYLLTKDDEDTAFFETPILFEAQNSGNRSGYGNQYCGHELISEGTKYGETTEYMCIGAEYSVMLALGK